MQPTIPVLDGHYDHWSMLMENLLKSKGYWHLIETGYKEPEKRVILSEVDVEGSESQELSIQTTCSRFVCWLSIVLRSLWKFVVVTNIV